MFKSSVILSLLPLLLFAVQATPIASQALDKRDSSPSVKLIFFSDNNCKDTVPETIYTRTVYRDEGCYFYPDQLPYRSVLIQEIDDRFMGTDSALQVGNTGGDTCDFTNSIKFGIGTKDLEGQCQFIGITSGQGKPLKGGNEYRLTTDQGC